jgi:hypothetical protein
MSRAPECRPCGKDKGEDRMKVIVFKPADQETALPRDAILRSTFKVGRFTCTLTVDCGAVAPGASGMMWAEWKPDLPRKLNARALTDYRAGRDALYSKVANAIGGNVMLAEL